MKLLTIVKAFLQLLRATWLLELEVKQLTKDLIHHNNNISQLVVYALQSTQDRSGILLKEEQSKNLHVTSQTLYLEHHLYIENDIDNVHHWVGCQTLTYETLVWLPTPH